MMKKIALSVIVIDPCADDAKTLLQELARHGFDVQEKSLQDFSQLRETILGKHWDIIFSEHRVGNETVEAALNIIHDTKLDLPLFVVSHVQETEFIVDAMRKGACDFISKNCLARLAPAVERELREKESRREKRAIEQALRLSEMRLKSLYSGNIVGFITASYDGKIIEANDFFLKMIGYSREELESGKLRWDAITPPDWVEQDERLIKRMLELNECAVAEKEYFHKDGRRIPVLVLAAHVQGCTDELTCLILDLSLRKSMELKLKESQEHFRELTENIQEVFWSFDLFSRTLLFISPSFEDLWCQSISEISKDPKRFLERVHPADIDKVTRMLPFMFLGSPASEEFRIVRPNGEVRWILSRSFPVYNEAGNIYRIAGLTEDITVRKDLEQCLRSAKEEADAASNAKSLFLAHMSHEIRTPLGAMLGFSELLADLPTSSVHERERMVEIIRRNGDLLQRIVDDILDLSKVESGKFEVELIPFSLRSLLSDLKSYFDIKANDKNISFEVFSDFDAPDVIVSDPMRVRQILFNIIGNAVKFTDEGVVRLRVNTAHNPLTPRTEQGVLSFFVEDSGTGIDFERQAELFQPYHQADSTVTRRFGGTGLGLVLSRRLAKLLGGELLLVESIPGKGSIFQFQLPLQVASITSVALDDHAVPTGFSVRTESEARVNLKLENLHILIVDDAEDNRILASRILKLAGAKVTLASCGREGVEKAQSCGCDIVLMDIQMGDISGYEATQLLRAGGFKLPILALTANAMKDEREKILEAGFDGHIPKPIRRDELIRRIQCYTPSHFIEKKTSCLIQGSPGQTLPV
jgi:PAS domain S-box-containing protein